MRYSVSLKMVLGPGDALMCPEPYGAFEDDTSTHPASSTNKAFYSAGCALGGSSREPENATRAVSQSRAAEPSFSQLAENTIVRAAECLVDD